MEEPLSFYYGIVQQIDHVDSKRDVKCALCHRTLMEADITTHAADYSHQQVLLKHARAHSFEVVALDRQTKITMLQRRLQLLDCRNCQGDVKESLFDFLTTGSNTALQRQRGH
jgi:hypothetical protein